MTRRYLWTARHGLKDHRPWPTWIAIGAAFLTVGLIGGYGLASWQTKALFEISTAHNMSLLSAAQCFDLPKKQITNKPQAQVITDRLDKERRSQP